VEAEHKAVKDKVVNNEHIHSLSVEEKASDFNFD
jgi:hypothetical protein